MVDWRELLHGKRPALGCQWGRRGVPAGTAAGLAPPTGAGAADSCDTLSGVFGGRSTRIALARAARPGRDRARRGGRRRWRVVAWASTPSVLYRPTTASAVS